MTRSSALLFSLLPFSLAACGGNTAVTTDNAGPGGSNSSSTDAGGAGGTGGTGGNTSGSAGSSAGGSAGSMGGSAGSSTGGAGGSSGGTGGVGGMPSDSAWDWVFGSAGDDNARGVAVDSGGNAVVLGTYQGSIDMKGKMFTSQMIDIFLAKVDTDGNLLWAKSFGTAQNDRSVNVDVNSQGQIFVAGSFGDFGGNWGGDPYNGTGPVFAKLAPDGTCLWTKAWILNGMGSWGGIVADPDGSSWVTGTFNGSINFGGGIVNSSGTLDPFIAHLDLNGGQVSVTTAAGNVNFRGQAADGKGGLFVSGSFKGTLDMGSGALTSADPMVADSFIAQLGANGKAAWAKKVPGQVQRVTVDVNGDHLVTGYFSGSADFGTGMMTSTGSDDIFVLKLDASGNALWTKHFGATSPDAGRSLAADAMGNVYLGGFFSGAPDFGMGPLVVGMQHNALVMKLSKDGQLVGAKGFGGDGNEEALYIAVDPLGFAFAWGELDAPGNYGSGVKTPVGMKDVFLVKTKF